VRTGRKYDHAALETEIEMDINEIVNSNRAKRRKIDVVLREDTELDRLFIATLEAAKDKKKCLALFGPVRVVTDRIKVTDLHKCG
jgi:hypothetical protein